MSSSSRRLDEALRPWVFDPEPGDWADVLRRAAEPGWVDVLQRARRPRLSLRLIRLSRRTIILAGVVLAIAGPALGLVAASQTIGREANVSGPRLTARVSGPDGGSGSFTASFAESMIAFRGPSGVRLAKPLRPGDRGDHSPYTRFVWKLELSGVPEAVDSVRLRARHGAVVATLCAPCVRPSGRGRLLYREMGALIGDTAFVEVRTSERTLRGRLGFVPRLHCGRRSNGGFVCVR